MQVETKTMEELPRATEGGEEGLRVREEEVASLKEALKLGAAKYRALLLSTSPEVPEELVSGETVEAVEASFAQARGVVEKVRQRLEARLLQERVPAGAPPRRPADLSALSPKEKIAFALGQGR